MGKRQQQQACTDPLSMLKIETNLYSVMDEHQRAYAKSMRATPVTFCDAKSGTGKTTIAVMVGLEGLSRTNVRSLYRFAMSMTASSRKDFCREMRPRKRKNVACINHSSIL